MGYADSAEHEKPSEFELECELRKQFGLSAFGMVEHMEIPWRIRLLLELIEKARRS